jgi:hypothetical protein
VRSFQNLPAGNASTRNAKVRDHSGPETITVPLFGIASPVAFHQLEMGHHGGSNGLSSGSCAASHQRNSSRRNDQATRTLTPDASQLKQRQSQRPEP